MLQEMAEENWEFWMNQGRGLKNKQPCALKAVVFVQDSEKEKLV